MRRIQQVSISNQMTNNQIQAIVRDKNEIGQRKCIKTIIEYRNAAPENIQNNALINQKSRIHSYRH